MNNFIVTLNFILNWKPLKQLLVLFFISLVNFSTAKAETTPAAEFLLSDGTLNRAALRGHNLSLDIKGWNVVLDPEKGPVFTASPPLLSEWLPLDMGATNEVYTVAVMDNEVYVGGRFSAIYDGINPNSGLNCIAKWDGTAWSSLGDGLNNSVFYITVAGSDLYVGGVFTAEAYSTPAVGGLNRIAKWDGFSWIALDKGLDNYVNDIVVDGATVYAAGAFTNTVSGSTPIDGLNKIAKWDGRAWSTLDKGLNHNVYSLLLVGSDLYVGGRFTGVGTNGTPVEGLNYLAKWNGTAWSALDKGLNYYVWSIATLGNALYVGGAFSDVGTGGTSVDGLNQIAKWNGSAWSPLDKGVNGIVYSLAVVGSDLYAGGSFAGIGAGGTPVDGLNYIGKWNGTAWSALDKGLNDVVWGLAASGDKLYVGGSFKDVGSGGSAVANLNGIAKWTLPPSCVKNYTVTGGGSYCTGGTGTAIGLSNSDVGVSYQLKKNGVIRGSAQLGTGNPISFGNQTEVGTYTVEGTRSMGGCSAMMSSNQIITTMTAPNISYTGFLPSYCSETVLSLSPTNTGSAPTVLVNPLDPITVSTFAGSSRGYSDGTGTSSKFSTPAGLAIDVSGNMYIADYLNHKIRKITPSGVVTTFAGSTQGYADGTGLSAQFNYPIDIAIDKSGNLYVVDSDNHKIRKITPAGEVSTFAGSWDGYEDGLGSDAQFSYPFGIGIDGGDNLYVADYFNTKIRKITPTGKVSTLAGSTEGFADGIGSMAQFNAPNSLVVDGSGNVYVADANNHKIRKITPTGVVSTFAGSTQGYANGSGTEAQFNLPTGLAIDGSGNIYVADSENDKIRKITPAGVVSTIAGSVRGYKEGLGAVAKFNAPFRLALDASGTIYVSDYNHKIRKIQGTAKSSLFTISPALPTGLTFDNITGLISGKTNGTTPTTIYTISTHNTCGINDAKVTFSTEVPANLYSVTGGGTYCLGGTGIPIGLSNSELGVFYQLKKNGINTGLPVAGTGSPISFGNQTAVGSYTVEATRTGAACLTTMTGSATVTDSVSPTPSVFISSSQTGAICAGTSVTFTATPQNGGSPTYQWRKGGIDISGERSSTYTSANLNDGDVISVVMTSNVVCISTPTATSSPITMVVKPLPTVNTIPNQAICDGLNTTPIAFSGTLATRFDWTNSIPSIGLIRTGNGNIDAFSGTNTTLIPATASIKVTPTYTNSGLTCTGTPTIFSITVNPRPAPINVSASQNYVCPSTSIALSFTGGYNMVTLFKESFNAPLTNWVLANNSTGSNIERLAWTLRPNGYSNAFTTPDRTDFYMSNSENPNFSSTKTSMTSPPFSTLGHNNLQLILSHHFVYSSNQTAKIQLSKDGSNWTDIMHFRSGEGFSFAFAYRTITIPPTFENQPVVYIRFDFTSNYGWYWAINDAAIVGMTTVISNPTWSSTPIGFTSTIAKPTDKPTVNTKYKVAFTNTFGCSREGNIDVTVKNLPTFTATPINILCNGGPKGKIEVVANTGTAPFYFSKDDGTTYTTANTSLYTFTDVASGTYKIKIKDGNGCESIAQDITVSEPTTLVITAPSVGYILCQFGETTISTTASGGTAPYQYSLNGGAFQTNKVFNVRAGDYRITAKDVSGCSLTTPLTNVRDGNFALQCPLTVSVDANKMSSDGSVPVSVSGNVSIISQCLTPTSTGVSDQVFDVTCGVVSPQTNNIFSQSSLAEAQKVILRTFSATIPSIVYSCFQTIYVRQPKMEDIAFPNSVTLTCANLRTEPTDTVRNNVSVAGTGFPSIDRAALNTTAYKGFTATYTDVRTTTSTGFTIQRTWKVSRCTGGENNTRTVVQTINVPNCTISTVSGAINRENGTGIQATTQLSNVETGTNITETGMNFSFRNLAANSRLQLRPTRPNTDWTNGVTMLDVSLLSKHLLDIVPINSPYNLISADVNADGSLDATDMLLMQRLILRLIPSLPNNNSWRFIYKKFIFPRPDNPFATDFPEILVIPNLTQAIANADFVAIKVGDINQSAGSVNIRGGAMPFRVLVKDKVLEKGKTYEIPIEMTLRSGKNVGEVSNLPDVGAAVQSLQFTLNVDKNAAKIEGISNGNLPNFTDNNTGFFQKEGVITAAWQRKNGELLDETAKFTMMMLTLKPTTNTRLSDILSLNSLYTEGVAYDAKGNGLPIELSFSNQKSASEKAVLFPNRPNPFTDETTISFTLPEASKAKLTICDLLGKVVMATEKVFAKGLNEVIFDATSTPSVSNGIFIVRLQTATGVLEQKIVLSR